MSLQDELARVDKEIQKNQALVNDPEIAPLAKEELETLHQQKLALVASISAENSAAHATSTDTNDPYDQSSALLEIRGAAGGDEAKLWAADLKRMYVRFASNNNYTAQELDEGTIKLKGKGAFGALKFESGVHRVQRVPTTEKQGRIHTSTASVAVLPEIPESHIQINSDDLEWQFTRAGGHGGQNVNKVNSAVRLTHKPTQLMVSVRQERSQQQNKAIALEILRSKLWESEEEKRQNTIDKTRRSAVGRGMRAEKIRTYNFPQNRVTDHRVKKSWINLEEVLNGDLSKIFASLNQHYN